MGFLVWLSIFVLVIGLLFWLMHRAAQTPPKPKNRPGENLSARWATTDEILPLATQTPAGNGLILATTEAGYLQVRGTDKRTELGHVLVVGPPRSGKGLMAVSQLLTWGSHAIISDPKGELFKATAGWRQQIGKVLVVDAASGSGHRYDPTASRQRESELRAWCSGVLADEKAGAGQAYVLKSVEILVSLLQEAQRRHEPGLGYVARALKGKCPYTDSLSVGAWLSLPSRLGALLDESVLRSTSRSDVSSSAFQESQPVTLYLMWPESIAQSRTPLVRALLLSLVQEVLDVRDRQPGPPVLVMVDEAGSIEVPQIEYLASTAAARHITLWLMCQSTAQLEATYGRDRAHAITACMDHNVHFRPGDQNAAEWLARRLGQATALRHSRSVTSQGLNDSITNTTSEWKDALVPAHELLTMADERVVVLTRGMRPILANRADWRTGDTLTERTKLLAPPIEPLPPLPQPGTMINREVQIPREVVTNGKLSPVDHDELWNRVQANAIRMRANPDMEIDCLLWLGPTNGKDGAGYGKLSGQYKHPAKAGKLVHVFAYEHAHGPIPEGLTVHHECLQIKCLEPAHLRLATRAENSREARERQKREQAALLP